MTKCQLKIKAHPSREYRSYHLTEASVLKTLFVRLFIRLSLLTMTNPNQLCDVLLFVYSKMADGTNLNSYLSVADKTREI